MLHDDFQYFIDQQDELLKRYAGKILVIKNQSVIGVYDTAIEAYTETIKEHDAGTFLIQECEPGVDAYTVTISSLKLAV